MKRLLLAAALLIGGATAANAAAPEGMHGNPVPLCSKTVRDECMNPSQAPGWRMKHQARRHHARHHRHVAAKRSHTARRG